MHRRIDPLLYWGLTLVISGAVVAAPAVKPTHGKSAAKVPGKAPAGAKKTEASLDDHPLLKRLTPVESGPGVLICEPVGSGAAKEIQDFGAGCGRWLHLMVGGQPECGKTPLWMSVDDARREAKLTSLRLPVADAIGVGRRLGCTHVGVGEIRGDANLCTLTYQLYEVAKHTRIGAPVTVTGTQEDVVAHLPEMARELGKGLGIPSARLPEKVGETTDELRQLGAYSWAPGNSLSTLAENYLYLTGSMARGLAGGDRRPSRPVLGALLYSIYLSSTAEANRAVGMTEALVKELPQNALALAETTRTWAQIRARSTPSLPTDQISKLRATYPHNCLLNLANSYCLRINKDLPAARRSVEEAVRCAPTSPAVWMSLDGIIGAQADAIRHGRAVGDLTKAELHACSQYYAEQVVVTSKAIRLAPSFAPAWNELSAAAAALGGDQLADDAYTRAEKLAPTSEAVLWWGLQLYQPKWLDRPARLKHVAEMTVAASDEFGTDERLELIGGLLQGGFVAEARKFAREDEERAYLDEYLHKLRERR